MTARPSSEYRSADIPWADRLPRDWGSASLKWLARIYAGGTPDRSRIDFWTEGTVPWLNSGSVNDWAITRPTTHITLEALATSSATWIPASSVVMALAGQGKTKGTAARLEIPSTCNQSMAAIVPGPALDYRYLHYWLAANYESIRNLAGGEARDGLNLQHVGSIGCPVPPRQTQRAIADFLDSQVSNIDNAVQLRRIQAHALEERIALLARAETADIEAERVPLRRLVTSVRTGSTPIVEPLPPGDVQGVEWFTPASFGNRLQLGEAEKVFHASTSRNEGLVRFDADSVLLVGIGATAGKVTYLDRTAAGNQQLTAIRTNGRMLPRFLMWQLHSRAAEIRAIAPFTTLPILNNEFLRGLPVTAPPLPRQAKAVARLDAALAASASALREMGAQLGLLQERKRSLIAAAVTGEFDVANASGRGA